MTVLDTRQCPISVMCDSDDAGQGVVQGCTGWCTELCTQDGIPLPYYYQGIYHPPYYPHGES